MINPLVKVLNGDLMNRKILVLCVLVSSIVGCQCLTSSPTPCDQMKQSDICSAYIGSDSVHLILNIQPEYAVGEKRKELMALIAEQDIEVIFELGSLPAVTVNANREQWLWLEQLVALDSISLSQEVEAISN